LVPTLRKAGILYRINGKFAEAEGLFNRALKIVESAEDPDSLERAKFLNYLAGSYNAQGKFAAAEDCFKKSLAIYEQDESLERFYLAAILFALALVCQRQNKLDESNRFNEKAKIVVESEIGGNVPRLSRRLLSIAQIYFAQEDFDKAELLLRQ
jgi:tetratricopeptide (TPR) repeat protein